MVASSSSPVLWDNHCCLRLQQPLLDISIWDNGADPVRPGEKCPTTATLCASGWWESKSRSEWVFFLKTVVVSELSLCCFTLVSRTGSDHSCSNSIVNLMVGSIEFRSSWNCWTCSVGTAVKVSSTYIALSRTGVEMHSECSLLHILHY